MKKTRTIIKITIILLITYLLTDLIIFRINTMPKLTQINHEDFIRDVDKINDLDTAKTELKRWINTRYDAVYSQNKLYIKYLYIIGFLFILNIIAIIIDYRKNNVKIK